MSEQIEHHSTDSPPRSPGVQPPSSPTVRGMMSYAERRMSAQGVGLYDTGRRRTSSFGTYSRVIIVAVDASEHSKNAFDWFLSNIWRLEDLIILVHCPEAPKLPSFSFKSGIAPPVEEWKKIMDETNTRARQIEEDFESTCSLKKLKFKSRSEPFKNIGEGICRIAEEEGGDLIVMGSQGTSALKFSSKGTVCDYVSRNSTVPTLVIPLKK